MTTALYLDVCTRLVEIPQTCRSYLYNLPSLLGYVVVRGGAEAVLF